MATSGEKISKAGGSAYATGGRCEFCGGSCSSGHLQGALIADSSAIDSVDFTLDGQRYVVACCPEHMKSLIENARVSWAVEELWFGRLCRASRLPGVRDADIGKIAVHARLDPSELRAALAWNGARNEPKTTLPGGQIVPLAPPPDCR